MGHLKFSMRLGELRAVQNLGCVNRDTAGGLREVTDAQPLSAQKRPPRL